MQFAAPAKVYFFNFANQVPIVPEHIWSTGDAAAQPETWADDKPIGTGAFTVNNCNPNNIEYTANPTYWQPGKPFIQKVEYPAYLDNGPANLDLATGKGQWGSQFIPNIKAFYLDKSPDNHTWSPPVTNVTLYPNLDPSHAATSKLEVRQAIAMALDRAKVALVGEGGQQPGSNQTGIVTPTFDKFFDSAAVASAGYDKPNPDKAKELLTKAGYGPDHPLDLSVITVTGYTDWDASLAVVKQQLAAVGINLTVQDLAQQTYDDKLYTGDFDLAYYAPPGGPTPYYEMRANLYSKNSAPIGQDGQLQLLPLQQPRGRCTSSTSTPSSTTPPRCRSSSRSARRCCATCRSSRSPRTSTGSSTTPRTSAAGPPSTTRTRSLPPSTFPTSGSC